MKRERRSGVLLHPTSLPGGQGIGGLGAAALEFIDFLGRARQTLWQMLPLGPTGYGNSPYSPFSSFAGNELLIDLASLVVSGDLSPGDVEDGPVGPPGRVDYDAVRRRKLPVLERAAARFLQAAAGDRREDFDRFCAENSSWLEDYALFICLKDRYQEIRGTSANTVSPWYEVWDEEVAARRPATLERLRRELRLRMELIKVLQYFFAHQWNKVRNYAQGKGIEIVGDLPIFVAPNSADVWANRELFTVDERGRPRVVSGVPPDYFSPTGQFWGNPLYDWDRMEATGFRWWIERLSRSLTLFDMVRLDHFRGFAACWEVAAEATSAQTGHWVEVPGARLFDAAAKELGELPCIAEDLGFITPEVVALRERLGFPGMRVLQFAFGNEGEPLNAASPFLPHNHSENSVVYTGTHDNDTTLGWYRSLPPPTQDLVRRYLARDDHDIAWDFVRLALSSVARYSIVPMQDLLALGSESRMNTPSTVGDNNWSWRLRGEETRDEIVIGRLREMTELYGRTATAEAAGEALKEARSTSFR